MNVNEHHVHHLAKRLHQAHSKLDELTGKWSERLSGVVSTVEVGTGAFLGGLLEGKTNGAALFDRVPYNLLAAGALLAGGHLAKGSKVAGDYSDDIINVGNGFLAGYIASKGFAVGQDWQARGKLFGGGGGSLPPGPVVQGELTPAQMQAMVDRMGVAG